MSLFREICWLCRCTYFIFDVFLVRKFYRKKILDFYFFLLKNANLLVFFHFIQKIVEKNVIHFYYPFSRNKYCWNLCHFWCLIKFVHENIFGKFHFVYWSSYNFAEKEFNELNQSRNSNLIQFLNILILEFCCCKCEWGKRRC